MDCSDGTDGRIGTGCRGCNEAFRIPVDSSFFDIGTERVELECETS